MKSRTKTLIAAALAAAVILISALTGCKLTPDEPPQVIQPSPSPAADIAELPGTYVVMRCRDVEMTLYDFGQAFYNSQYFQYYMYGMIQPSQYCDLVVQELSTLVYAINAAADKGIELSDEELAEIDSTIQDHLSQVLDNYETKVEGEVEDKRAEAKKLFEADLAQDGLTFDDFIKLATNNLIMMKLAEKYYKSISDDVEVTDDEITAYVSERIEEAKTVSMSDFVSDMSAYFEGTGPCPVYIPDDCFSVNHIYIAYGMLPEEDGGDYDTESRLDTEAEIEARLPELAGFDEFMELETEYGEDPGMDEVYRDCGYLIHPDLVDDYFEGFVYAAMNLHDGSWTTPPKEGSSEEPKDDPELKYFALKDGTKVVKVRTESGVHYLILNKEYAKGEMPYTKGDDCWNSWRSSIVDTKLSDVFEQLGEEWEKTYPIEVDIDVIKAKYAPEGDPDPDKK